MIIFSYFFLFLVNISIYLNIAYKVVKLFNNFYLFFKSHNINGYTWRIILNLLIIIINQYLRIEMQRLILNIIL